MINMNDILMFENIHGYTENGNTFFLIDDIVKELGFGREQNIKFLHPEVGAKEYHKESVRWSRINEYLVQYNLSPPLY